MNEKDLQRLYDEYSDRQREADRAESFQDVAFTAFIILLTIAIAFIFRTEIKAFSKTLPTTTTEQHNTITK
jgi:hypothetical protein